MLNSPALENLDGIRHGFFTRQGGVSQGLYSSLNCGFGADEPRENVLENRARALARMGSPDASLVTAYQIHSADVHIVEQAWSSPDEAPKGDALVTNKPGIALGIMTADCTPVLFADPVSGVIGAAHAGWQGAIKGVTDSTITAMESLGARRENIHAAIGPCIAQISYEVGAEFAHRFCEEQESNLEYFIPSPREGRFLFDLRRYVGNSLKASGIKQLSVSKNDTYSESELFFSYRRSCHFKENDYGRGLSAIVLEE
ncbi:peptidoglycan editing factor PgeF [Kiloniella laminariae]|uniref:Purine nucleoside phosphorylase n=1 Tax=Kiloniella laminariae TaxID=454162 RepID=A0ABT4LL76_9PROT|nr:peptidoglycan editing factor PgeF [Kiloniella laminariae]MCZ4281861.1 peptidoglycan editing factor PgeF [Kiloniella laminariae]